MVAALLLLVLLAAPATAEEQDLDIAAPDGLGLGATYYPANDLGPGVLMLHQCNRERRSWEEAARALADAGIHVLTFDFRGFGESKNDAVRDYRTQHEALWPQFDGDVDRAVDFFVTLPLVDGERLGVIGASCGGTQALLLAMRRPQVRTVVLLSSSLPWLDDAELEAFDTSTPIPILGITAEEDRQTRQRTERVFRGSVNPHSRLVVYKGERHGVPLFEQEGRLLLTVVEWFSDHL